jgi:polyferredoxin
MPLRRFLQLFCLIVFLSLLLLTAADGLPGLDRTFFLRLDPGLMLLTASAARSVTVALLPVMVLLGLTVLMGRFFCGYICPMGTTIDGGDALWRVPRKQQSNRRGWRRIKVLVLIFLLGSSLLSISLVFLAAPLSLITRFYGVLLQPLAALIGERLLLLSRPLLLWLDVPSLLYVQVDIPRFATQFFVLAFFLGLFGCARLFPRFWCRVLCPAGAILALFSYRPLIRRRVSSDCRGCGRCARRCPMGAIDLENTTITQHQECIVCRECVKGCPEKAVTFGITGERSTSIRSGFLPTRRRLLLSGLAGIGTAALGYTGLNTALGRPGKGQVAPVMLLRPPAALPEPDFLARCTRCGQCLVVCPTNTLQPIWLEAGFAGLFSPALKPRRGFCDPACHRCADNCPTGAIFELTAEERKWAKVGTALILPGRCLAWEHQKRCMVCDEVCPYDAIHFRAEPGNPVAVPVVDESRCAGCGYCEYYCPAQNQSAIVVTPMGALRLKEGRFREYGQRQGLELSLAAGDAVYAPDLADTTPGPAPGFTD